MEANEFMALTMALTLLGSVPPLTLTRTMCSTTLWPEDILIVEKRGLDLKGGE